MKLTINPNTVARVYQELEREGIIETARGLGSFVASRREEYGTAQARSLESALENLMVEAYQLAVDEATLRLQFEKRLAIWRDRLKKGDE